MMKPGEKSKLLKELKGLTAQELVQRCTCLIEENREVPASIVRRLEDYQRVLQMSAFDAGFHARPLAGVDEAGRGPLAGSVYTAAVIFSENTVIEGLNDSKKLSEKKREALFDEIIKKALSYAIVPVDCSVIDKINIRNATYQGMNQAVNALSVPPAHVLIDGDAVKDMQLPHSCVIHGDAQSLAISAASILAKVSRDRYMVELDAQYPQYGFAKHKGYGTRQHIDALQKYGPCPIHRRTFLKNFGF